MTRRASSIRLRRAATTALKAVVSCALLAFLIDKVGVHSLLSLLRHVHPWWLVIAFICSVLGAAVQTTQWRSLLRAVGLVRSWPRCFRVVMVGLTFNSILPTSIGGDVVRALMIAESPRERVDAGATVVLQRLCNFPGMIVVLVAGLLLTLTDPAAVRVRPVGAAASLVGLAIIVVFGTPIWGTIARIPLLERNRVGRAASKLFIALHTFRGRRRELGAAWFRGLLFWLTVSVNQWALVHSLGINASLPLAALVAVTINAITLLPLSINGLGIREGGFAAFLSVAGLATASQGLAAGLLVSAQTVFLALLGLPFLWQPRRGRRSAEATALVQPRSLAEGS